MLLGDCHAIVLFLGVSLHNIIDVQNVVNGRVVAYVQLDSFTWPPSDVEVLAGVFGGKPRPQSSRTVVLKRKQPALAASTINSQL